MIRVAILGQPFWGLRFAGILNARKTEVEATFLSPRSLATPVGLGLALKADILLRVGYRPGAPTWRGRAFDALWALLRLQNPRAKGVQYWIGTDALNSLVDFRAGRLRRGPMERAKGDLHWADAPWLVTELAEIGLTSRYIALPVPLKDITPPERLPAPFTVLTYIPDARADFYDGPSILSAARALPGVRFEVIGGEGGWQQETLPNLSFFGWQKDVRPFLSRASVVVRLLRHDGMGGTVREALEAGRHVIYSHPMPCVVPVPFQNPAALEAAIRDLHVRFEAGKLLPNHAGHLYVRENFNLDTCLNIYLADLRRHLARPASPERP